MEGVKKMGFTLVELLVTVVILTTLAAIASVTFVGYLSGVRDVARVTAMASLTEALSLHQVKNFKLPLPNQAVSIQIDGKIIGYQGNLGADIIDAIQYPKAGTDPKDGSYFSYYVSRNKREFQLMAFMEESNLSLTKNFNILETTAAAQNNKARYPQVSGGRLGIMTDIYNTPIQDISTIQEMGRLNVTQELATPYTAIFSNAHSLTASGNILKTLASNANCRRIKETKPSAPSGIYTINPQGNGRIKAYCNMDTQDGGWTIVHLINTDGESIFALPPVNKNQGIFSIIGGIATLWGDNEEKDILLSCQTKKSFHSIEENIILVDYKKSDLPYLLSAKSTFSTIPVGAKINGEDYTLGVKFGKDNRALIENITEKVLFQTDFRNNKFCSLAIR